MAPYRMSTRPRRSLPEGYQFGDMGDPFDRMTQEQKFAYCRERYVEPVMKELRRRELSGNLDQADRDMLRYLGWNVIEGDHFDTDRDTGDETTQ